MSLPSIRGKVLYALPASFPATKAPDTTVTAKVEKPIIDNVRIFFSLRIANCNKLLEK